MTTRCRRCFSELCTFFRTADTVLTVPFSRSDEALTGSSVPESATLAQFNKSWAELSDWLAMLDNMVQNKRVVVADLDDINDNIGVLKVSVCCQMDFFFSQQ